MPVPQAPISNQDVPLETRRGHITKTVDSYKSYVTSPLQAFGQGPPEYWGTVRMTGQNLTTQHLKHAPFWPGAFRELIQSLSRDAK